MITELMMAAQQQAVVRMENKKSEVGELRTLLRSVEIQRNPKRYLQVVQKVIAYMTLGVDVSKLFSEMIMAGATQHLVQKKLVYLYLTNYAESNSELALLTINTLQKDCRDRNPMIRGLALRNMCSLRIPSILEYLSEPLQAGLADRSAYVRKTAVMGVVKVFYLEPGLISQWNLVDVLYQMLRDKDPQVVSNCISALNEVLANEGGMVVNTKIAHYLMNRLREFNEWGQCQVMDLLSRYSPANEDEIFDILNVLDDRLRHTNSGVVLAATRLILQFTEDLADIHHDIFQRIRVPLLTFLGTSCPEVAYSCLQHIQLILARQSELWSTDYQTFFCRYNDPPYLKMKKLEVLTEVCTIGNAQDIVGELGEIATDVNASVARKAINAVSCIALRLPAKSDLCVDKLLSLLTMEMDYVTAETLIVMTNILRKFDNMVEVTLSRLPTRLDAITDPEGKAALIWILGEYGESLPNTPYILEELIDQMADESSSIVKLQLLTATMKLFFKRPPECHAMLGRLLEYAIDEEGDMDVHDRGLLYYRLLKKDIKEAQRIVSGHAKTVIQENTVIPRLGLFSEFNTLAVVYGTPSINFISQETPYVILLDGSRGADYNFDWGSSDGSVSGGPSPQPSPQQPHRDVDIDFNDILVDVEAPIPNTPPPILLDPNPSLTAKEFEAKWQNLTKCHEIEVSLVTVPHSEELQRALASRYIMTMASSPSNQPTIKFFLYAQHVSTRDFFLMEVNINVAMATLALSLKCEKLSLLQHFLKHFFQTFFAQRWLSK